ncbi:MAG: GNAT family N-acetyltransferase [Acidobacteria bacterium]|nr:GNAT family N-acetyltransferase [Acidobacteriota bacterium]MCA1640411.1 GNAT family N-acetyltransferase [Acidobacteriota bacterium]
MHPAYAESLAEFGSPRQLARCGAWLLEREIPGSGRRDAMGCYPIFSCPDWSQLRSDLDAVGDDLVSVSLVADPFGEYDEAYLKECFRDVVAPFKQHFVVDLGLPADSFVHAHHRRNARKARRVLSVERYARAPDALDEWTALYGVLSERHAIEGVAAFSKESFAKQLGVPGMVALRATEGETTTGMLLWYVQGDAAYYHLGAYSARGYELRASFALFSHALEYFAGRGLRWLNLGGAAGAGETASGLSRFKEGWSSGVRTAYFCGRIFDRKGYEELVAARNAPPTAYFPAYRLGEFR